MSLAEVLAQGSHIRPPGIGKVFYVHGWTWGTPIGNDANNGIDPSTPFLTIRHALDQCVDLRNDYIIVLNHWSEITPIHVDKQRVHILGLAIDEMPVIAMTTDHNDPVFMIDGDLGSMCEIAGFDLGGGDAHGGIEPLFGGSTASSVYIHDCNFGSEFCGDTALYGIWLPPGSGAKAWKIVRCKFMGSGIAGGLGTLVGSGVRIDEGAHHEVKDCLFMGCVAPTILAEGHGLIIRNNDIAMPADAAGGGITIGATSLDCIISNNRASFGEALAGLFNPYLDNAAVNANVWIANYRNEALTVPG